MDNKTFRKRYHIGYLKYYTNAVAGRLIKREIFGIHTKRKIAAAEEGNQWLYEKIMEGKPFVAGRFGGTELKTICDVLYTKAGGKAGGVSERTAERIAMLSGFFPQDKELLYPFQELYMECCPEIDALGMWNIVLQGEIADEYLPQAKLFELRMFEPYYFIQPWTRALEGKRVLVIHPFADTIESQFKKREHLFRDSNVLPEFEICTLKAVQTLAGEKDERFQDWFEALEYMYQEALKKEFDVALIGCGAYGLPLSVKLKKVGKMAVHVGGALQLLFGIKGKRWDEHEVISKLYNEYWVRPGENEKMREAGKVEGGCYW
ncbi:MAG: hypothetical protein GX234_06235 [Clostridiales bacterium]|nr:hypothetical protein [Clostridiales bacterium]